MKRSPERLEKVEFSRAIHPGMTLMEVVIAIGLVAFVLPLIFAATGLAGSARLNAEADTRSAWIANQVKQELFVTWGEHPSESVFAEKLDFPHLASSEAPEILIYDSKGKFLVRGNIEELTAASQIVDASYIVTIYAEEYKPPNLATNTCSLCMLHIRIIHPAKARPSSRSTYRYNLITSKHGTL